MNPAMIAALLRTLLASSTGTTEQSNPALWGSPEEQLSNVDAQVATPIDRIKSAFSSLKDMHKGPGQTSSPFRALGPNSPSPMDSATWPHGPIGAPQPQQMGMPQRTQASVGPPMQLSPQMQVQTPMQTAMGPESAPMSFFQRNAALQRDPISGEYLDPTAAEGADPGIFKGLFA